MRILIKGFLVPHQYLAYRTQSVNIFCINKVINIFEVVYLYVGEEKEGEKTESILFRPALNSWAQRIIQTHPRGAGSQVRLYAWLTAFYTVYFFFRKQTVSWP